MFRIKTSFTVLALLAFTCAESETIKEPEHLLISGRKLSFNQPVLNYNGHHITTVTFHSTKLQPQYVMANFKTYALDGSSLTSCDTLIPWDSKTMGFEGEFQPGRSSLTSLGNNETEVLTWILNDKYSTIYVRVINTTNCEFVDDELPATTTGHPTFLKTFVYVVPYVNSFDLVFPMKSMNMSYMYYDGSTIVRPTEVVNIKYGADGLLIKNPSDLVEGEARNVTSIKSVHKYSETENRLVIYDNDSQNLTAVLINPSGKVLKRKWLLDLYPRNPYIFNILGIFGKVDHGKLVLCDMRTMAVKCRQYNGVTLEPEVESTEIKFKALQAMTRILILPDGGYLLLTMAEPPLASFENYVDKFDSYLTKVDANGNVQEIVKITTCRMFNFNSPPQMYLRNNKICLVHLCESMPPFNKRYILPYTTQISCY